MKKKKSSPGKSGDPSNPIWNEAFTFNLSQSNLQNAALEVLKFSSNVVLNKYFMLKLLTLQIIVDLCCVIWRWVKCDWKLWNRSAGTWFRAATLARYDSQCTTAHRIVASCKIKMQKNWLSHDILISLISMLLNMCIDLNVLECPGMVSNEKKQLLKRVDSRWELLNREEVIYKCVAITWNSCNKLKNITKYLAYCSVRIVYKLYSLWRNKNYFTVWKTDYVYVCLCTIFSMSILFKHLRIESLTMHIL